MRVRLGVEWLEDRRTPSAVINAMNAAADDHSPGFYRGDGLHTPAIVVPQDRISGPGVNTPGQADGAGALLFVFGTTPA
ncbi:MAG: hypothetical protein L0Z62_04980 [Gemmataceae bacterium]|nr:hypothetical protein [Gemmataceae bacterium]